MASNKYGFLPRLIDKIPRKDCPNNNTFVYYHHLVELLSGTVDYVDATVYTTEDRYSDTLVSFSFDFWTQELVIASAVDKEIEQCVIDAFKSLYRGVKVVTEEVFDEPGDADEEGAYEFFSFRCMVGLRVFVARIIFMFFATSIKGVIFSLF